jgi:hypothetical protein
MLLESLRQQPLHLSTLFPSRIIGAMQLRGVDLISANRVDLMTHGGHFCRILR